jgi:hypothetical protein
MAFDVLPKRPVGYPTSLGVPDTDGLFHRGYGRESPVLSQIQGEVERVIAYASSMLSRAQQAYCTTKWELLAVVKFVEHFWSYLAGSNFLIRTDHASLRWLVDRLYANPLDHDYVF